MPLEDELDELITDRLALYRDDGDKLEDLAAQLVAGLSLTVAVQARGNHRVAEASCEALTHCLFERVTSLVDKVEEDRKKKK